ncbi:WXG100 family type VII secretion target [Saccharopolyspora shandongensis]|uniref:WXG100 family type VII secretion target n=1 Tax=Saccharopolyspora shandongensis TaxID=418495 RepID=A0A1H3L5V7_9PSEU|nr:WXG100 family type VII secretion target [Saccharopolyspora shandongensis]SDY59720.1 WXG100 family type VII secretion target [Saccharopolyspora shandongensis]
MGQPTYTYSAVDNNSVTDAMQDAGTTIKKELGDLDAEVTEHLNNWTADAKTAYAAAKGRWDAAADTMPVSLSHAAEKLAEITRRLNAADDSVTGMW